VIAVDAEKVSEFKLEITHLVTIGCSFTYCQGLTSPSTQGWPALVAKKLNIPLVNLAVPGVGNDFIHRVSHEYIYRNLPTNSKPLFIVAWSQYWRWEQWVKEHYYNTAHNDYAPFMLPDSNEKLNPKFELYFENFDDRNSYRKTFLFKLSLMNLFKAMDIPYMMTDYSHDIDIQHDFLKDLTYMTDIIDSNPYKIEDFFKVAQDGQPKLSCGHDGEKTQTTISNYTLSKIHNLFPNLSVIDSEFFTLPQFLKTSSYHQKFPEWCNFKL
jgi:hypothetical protein